MSNKLKNIVGIICLLCIFSISLKELNADEFAEYKLVSKGNWTFVQLRPVTIFSSDFNDKSSKLSFIPEILDKLEKEQNVEIKSCNIMTLDSDNFLSYWLLVRHTPK